MGDENDDDHDPVLAEPVIPSQATLQVAANSSTITQSASGSSTNIAIVLQANLQVALNLLGVDPAAAGALLAGLAAELQAALLEGLPTDGLVLLEVTDGEQVVQSIVQLAANGSTITQSASGSSTNIAIVLQTNVQVAVNAITQPRRRRRIRVRVSILCPIPNH